MGKIGIGLLAVLVVAIGLLKAWPIVNVVETGETPEYPDLLPRLYDAPPDLVFDAVLHAVNGLSRWTLVSHDAARGRVAAEAKSRLWGFVDDVTIRVVEEGVVTSVHVRSGSRVGRGDFGQNARNIRALYKALDGEMAKGAGHS